MLMSQACCRFIYTATCDVRVEPDEAEQPEAKGHAEIKMEPTMQLLIAAHRFQLLQLAECCEQNLVDSLTDSNVSVRYEFATMHGLVDLKVIFRLSRDCEAHVFIGCPCMLTTQDACVDLLREKLHRKMTSPGLINLDQDEFTQLFMAAAA